MDIAKHKSLIAIALICTVIMLLPAQLRELLYLHINDFKQGEYWRFFSAHLTHYSWTHCLTNVAGLFLLAGIFAPTQQNIYWLIAAIISGVIISGGIVLFSSQLEWYVGFSGILTSLYAYASIKTFTENKKISTFILITLIGYVAIQVHEGELISSMLITDLNTSSYAHAYGLFAGILYGLIERFYLKMSIDKSKR